MRKFLALFCLLFSAMMIIGCATLREVNKTRENLTRIKMGMPKEEIIAIMGSPRDREVFILENGQTFEVLKYLTQYDIAGPILNSDTTPICLQEGKVIGWGQKFYISKKKKTKFLFQ